MTLRVGCCITPHGFGHAARTAAILAAIGRQMDIEPVLCTTVPRWFFADSLSMPFSYHPSATDIGLVQKNSLVEDLPATLQALDGLYPLSEKRIERAAEIFKDCGCILCDIAPLGIAAARRLGVPSVLIENFTWDWIYEGYLDQEKGFLPYIEYLQLLYRQADYHLQTIPICHRSPGAVPIAPVSRVRKMDRAEIRRLLAIDEQAGVVLMTMGGIGGDAYDTSLLQRAGEYVFLFAGQEKSLPASGNIRFLPRECGIFHPDLIGASDLVVGKVGYSTLAEVYAAGVPWAYISRKSFPESRVLVDFIRQNHMGAEVSADDVHNGSWLDQLPDLVNMQSNNKERENGADGAADFIIDRVL
ncbi:MAG TPA: hypothetical protein ENJ30_01805 [Desulfobulbaceae bacterium]|nr:hypothetical protein [Desulfobulbaceae bacterium]